MSTLAQRPRPHCCFRSPVTQWQSCTACTQKTFHASHGRLLQKPNLKKDLICLTHSAGIFDALTFKQKGLWYGTTHQVSEAQLQRKVGHWCPWCQPSASPASAKSQKDLICLDWPIPRAFLISQRQQNTKHLVLVPPLLDFWLSSTTAPSHLSVQSPLALLPCRFCWPSISTGEILKQPMSEDHLAVSLAPSQALV